MFKTIGMVSLGCAKNRVDAEVMLGLLKREGFELVNDSSSADAILVNTCGFIGPAKEESIQAILEQAEYKREGTCKALIVTGCLAERYAEDLKKEIPEIDAVIGTSKYTDILDVLKDVSSGHRRLYTGDINRALVEDLPRVVSTGKRTAYLKIAEGCDNHCTYCIIPKLRGRFRSRDMSGLLREAEALVAQGIREIIVVAQDVTCYGKDLNKGYGLTELLKELCKIEQLHWIRLLYSYPDRITDELLNLIAEEKKICRYLDIPIQHISPRILKRMNRAAGPETIFRVIRKIRSLMPDAVLRTSLITGFPGETENEFMELLEFIRRGEFDHIGVFPYSPEEDTPAVLLPEHISEKVKEFRRLQLMAEQKKISKRRNRKRIGQITEVLLEGKESDKLYYGRSYGEAPDIDGLIYIYSETPLTVGDFVQAKLTKAYEYDLLGENYESGK